MIKELPTWAEDETVVAPKEYINYRPEPVKKRREENQRRIENAEKIAGRRLTVREAAALGPCLHWPQKTPDTCLKCQHPSHVCSCCEASCDECYAKYYCTHSGSDVCEYCYLSEDDSSSGNDDKAEMSSASFAAQDICVCTPKKPPVCRKCWNNPKVPWTDDEEDFGRPEESSTSTPTFSPSSGSTEPTDEPQSDLFDEAKLPQLRKSGFYVTASGSREQHWSDWYESDHEVEPEQVEELNHPDDSESKRDNDEEEYEDRRMFKELEALGEETKGLSKSTLERGKTFTTTVVKPDGEVWSLVRRPKPKVAKVKPGLARAHQRTESCKPDDRSNLALSGLAREHQRTEPCKSDEGSSLIQDGSAREPQRAETCKPNDGADDTHDGLAHKQQAEAARDNDPGQELQRLAKDDRQKRKRVMNQRRGSGKASAAGEKQFISKRQLTARALAEKLKPKLRKKNEQRLGRQLDDLSAYLANEKIRKPLHGTESLKKILEDFISSFSDTDQRLTEAQLRSHCRKIQIVTQRLIERARSRPLVNYGEYIHETLMEICNASEDLPSDIDGCKFMVRELIRGIQEDEEQRGAPDIDDKGPYGYPIDKRGRLTYTWEEIQTLLTGGDEAYDKLPCLN